LSKCKETGNVEGLKVDELTGKDGRNAQNDINDTNKHEKRKANSWLFRQFVLPLQPKIDKEKVKVRII
jgi:hypothetical protein